MKRNLLIILLVIFTAGCSHVPLSTMVSMSGFDEEDFVQIEGKDIRTRITTDTAAKFAEEDTELNFKLTSPEYRIDKTVSLEIISDNLGKESQWFGEDTLKHTTTFKLSEAGLKEFREIQQLPQLTKRPENSKVSFSVRWKFNDLKEEKVNIDVELLLLPTDGYFTLIEDLELVVGESKEL